MSEEGGFAETPCDEVKDFFGVYLLVSHSPETKFKGRTYIGYTVDPNRRIAQHNKGCKKGGAKRTSSKGPWKMVLIVHGFPNNISALRFEWAWQQPKESRRLKKIHGLDKKRAKESQFQHKFRILAEMLRIGPWDRLPLTIRWLCSDYFTDFPALKPPPLHMNICCGRVVSKRRKAATGPAATGSDSESKEGTFGTRCFVCTNESHDAPILTCINKNCPLRAHLVCLAGVFLRDDPESIIPVEGTCPGCQKQVLWGDLIRRLNGSMDLVDDPADEDLELSEVSSDGDGEGD